LTLKQFRGEEMTVASEREGGRKEGNTAKRKEGTPLGRKTGRKEGNFQSVGMRQVQKRAVVPLHLFCS
jgi:hypothetical protein